MNKESEKSEIVQLQVLWFQFENFKFPSQTTKRAKDLFQTLESLIKFSYGVQKATFWQEKTALLRSQRTVRFIGRPCEAALDREDEKLLCFSWLQAAPGGNGQ